MLPGLVPNVLYVQYEYVYMWYKKPSVLLYLYIHLYDSQAEARRFGLSMQTSQGPQIANFRMPRGRR